MTGGRPDRCAENQGCLVSALAFGQFGWQHPGCRRQPGQRESLRTAVGQSGNQRLPASALRVLGGKRDARIVRHANERLWRWGNHAGPQGITRAQTGYVLWKKARDSGADLLWRVKRNLRLPCEERLSDGSYLSTVYRSDKDRRRGSHGIRVRVIEYTLEGVAGAEPIYRLVTSILDPGQAPAQELAALYHERWEIETTLDELKTHLRGSKIVLRSKTPDLVRQEFYGLMMTHFAIRGLMHEAALQDREDPDRLSLVHAVRVVRRKLPRFVAIPPSGQKSVP